MSLDNGRFLEQCNTSLHIFQVLEEISCKCPENDIPDAVFSKLSEKLNVPLSRLKDRYKNTRINCNFE